MVVLLINVGMPWCFQSSPCSNGVQGGFTVTGGLLLAYLLRVLLLCVANSDVYSPPPPHFLGQNMSDAMAILHKLQTGLDVNVKFTGVRVFEYTPECIVFDLLDIPLYHGWLVDPQVSELGVLLWSCSGLCPMSEKLLCTVSACVPPA